MIATKMSFEILIIVFIGIFVGKSKIVQNGFADQLSNLILNVCLPCLIIDSLCIEFSIETLKNSFYLIALSIFELIVGFLIGHIMCVKTKKSTIAKIKRYGFMFTNFTFIGLPIIESFNSETLLFYYSIMMIPIRICMYSMSQFLLAPSVNRNEISRKERIKNFFSPTVCALIIGIFMFLTGFRFPVIISDVIATIRGLTSCLGLLLCGIVLSQFNLKSLLSKKYILYSILRTIFLPMLYFFAFKLLGLDKEVIIAAVLCSACPCAVLIMPFTLKYNKDNFEAQKAAGSLVFMSTLFSAFTIPFWLHLIDLML